MDQLDLRLVRYFVAVAQELHFGRAAERLHIAQPSLSQQIRRLESQLGVALLTRTSRRVELTTAGAALLRDGEQLLQQARRTVQTVRRTADETLAVGYYGTAASRLLPGTLAAFGERRPSTTVSVRELLFGDLDDIISGGVDLAFTRLRADQLGHLSVTVAELASEPRVLAVARSHRLAGRISVSLRELGEDRFIVNPGTDPNALGRWKDEQRRHGLPGRIAGRARSVTELLTMVAAGIGITLVPVSVARQHRPPTITYIPVTDAEEAVISLVWPTGTLSPSAQAFVEAAQEQARLIRFETVAELEARRRRVCSRRMRSAPAATAPVSAPSR
ncbi:MAG: LysR family transcriptional regulator [Solirubrobacteraceae bacterium]